jgi:hypothetical protein
MGTFVRVRVGVLTALTLATAACGAGPASDDSSSAAATATSKHATATMPTVPPATTTFVPAEEDAVAAATASYRRFVGLQDESARTGVVSMAQFTKVSGDPALAKWVGTIDFYKKNGLAQRGSTKVSTTHVDAVDLDKKPYPEVRLTACLDVSGYDLIIKRTGKSATGNRTSGRLTTPVKVVQYKGRWLVIEAETDEDAKPC